MPTYQRFEDLPVWQVAIRLGEGCEDFLGAADKRITWSKRDQLDRAELSVSNNIAEGFERGTTNELLAFLYIARGSAGEVRSMLAFFERRPALNALKSQISNLKSVAESCSRQLRAWAESLQNSDIAGQRHLNDKSRASYQKCEARAAGVRNFQKLLLQHTIPVEHQGQLPLDANSDLAPAAPPELRDEIARTWGLPIGERVEVRLRNDAIDALVGVLELAAAPEFPWNPRDPLSLRIAGFGFSSRDIAQWTRQ